MTAFAVVDRTRSVGSPAVSLAQVTSAVNLTFRVTAKSGASTLRVGDIVIIRDPRLAAALLLSSLRIGSTFVVERLSPGPPSSVSILVRPARPVRFSFLVVLLPIAGLLLAMAFIVALRGAAVGALSLAMLFSMIVMLVNPTTPSWPRWTILTYAIVSSGFLGLGSIFAIDFATRLTQHVGKRARRIRRWSVGVGAASIAFEFAVNASTFFQPTTPVWLGNLGIAALLALPMAFVATLVTVYATATTLERPRVSWVVASLGLGTIGILITIVMSALGISEPVRDYPLLLVPLIPIGCAYSILRYRLLDIGFVLNRAAVFGATSLVVLGALALVDLVLQHVLGSWLVANGASIQIAVALAIGVATRPLHARVDTFVDDVFFRERHAAELRLRALAHDVAFIDDPAVALSRAVATVADASHLRCTALLKRDGCYTVAASSDDERLASIGRNDGGVVRLLAMRSPIDLNDLSSMLPGEFAFPMFARNRLLGILVCGDRTTAADPYAPDEISAIAAVAGSLGIALDQLRIEALERDLGELRRTLPVPIE